MLSPIAKWEKPPLAVNALPWTSKKTLNPQEFTLGFQAAGLSVDY